jgi:hypothetical protein
MTTNALSLVREAHMNGATTRKEITVLTGLSQDLVELCVDLLISQKEIDVTNIKGACTIGGCSSCGEDSNCHPSENIGGKTFVQLSKRADL